MPYRNLRFFGSFPLHGIVTFAWTREADPHLQVIVV